MPVIIAQPEPEEIGLIQGHTPDSKEEWWVALALWKLEIEFKFQFQILGGRSRRGGQVVDFLVYMPDEQPLQVHGKYWHKADLPGGDIVNLVALEDYFKKEVLVLWATDADTKEDVYQFIEKEVAK